MVLKLWNIDNGKVTHLKYTSSKNESKLVKLKEPIEFDRIPLSDIDKAIELMNRYVSSITKFDVGEDNKVETRQDNKVEVKKDGKVVVRSDGKVDTKSVEDKSDRNVEDKSDRNVDAKSDRNVEDKSDRNVDAKSDGKVEDKSDGNVGIDVLIDDEDNKEVPQEVSDKLDSLLKVDEGRKDGPRFLINKNVKKSR
jgi:hypothetical protein